MTLDGPKNQSHLLRIVPTTQDIKLKHLTYEGALITEGVFDIEEMDKIHTMWIAQLPKNKEARVIVKSKIRKIKND